MIADSQGHSKLKASPNGPSFHQLPASSGCLLVQEGVVWLALFCCLHCASSFSKHEASCAHSPSTDTEAGGRDADRKGLPALTVCDGVLVFSGGCRCLKVVLFLMCAGNLEPLGDVLDVSSYSGANSPSSIHSTSLPHLPAYIQPPLPRSRVNGQLIIKEEALNQHFHREMLCNHLQPACQGRVVSPQRSPVLCSHKTFQAASAAAL